MSIRTKLSNSSSGRSNSGSHRRIQSGLKLVAGTLAIGVISATTAFAQCTENHDLIVNNVPAPGQIAPASVAVPLGSGSALTALAATISSVNSAFTASTSAFVSSPGSEAPNRTAYGAWARGLAGSSETETRSVGGVDTSTLAGGGFPFDPDGIICNTTVKSSYAGVQLGVDIANLNLQGSGANFFFGVTGGWIKSKTEDQTPGVTFINPNLPGVPLTSPAGDLEGDTDVPFIGLYGAYTTKGGFYVDGQVRSDFYSSDLTSAVNGLPETNLEAQGLSFIVNTGIQIPMGNGWAILPSAGFMWSRVQVDNLFVPGLLTTGGFPYGRGTVVVEDIDSRLSRFSIQISKQIRTGNLVIQPFGIASVFREWSDEITGTSITQTPTVPGINNAKINFGIERVEKYVQLGLGAGFAILDTNWRGYIRGDYKNGGNIEGWGVNGGLRYNFNSPLSGGG